MYSILYNSQNSELMAIVIKVLSNVRHSSSLLKPIFRSSEVQRYHETRMVFVQALQLWQFQ